MKKIIFAQVFTTNGKTCLSKAQTIFKGLYDENGVPVSIEMECDDVGTSLTIWRNVPDRERRDCGISEE